jgi:UDP-glucose 4-epimerase
VHVDDLCRAVLLAIEGKQERGGVYFIAEKTAYTLRELVEHLVKASGGWAVPLFVPGGLLRIIAAIAQASLKLVGKVPMLTPEKAGELLASWEVSTEKAKRDFGFESEIAFPNGARETFAWYREKEWL